MKNLWFLAIALYTMIFVSCSKDAAINTPTDPIVPVLTKKMSGTVSTYTDGTQETETLRFDSKGNLTQYQDDDDTYAFDYSTPQKVFVTRRNTKTNVANLTYECDLNEKGLATKVVLKNVSGVVVTEMSIAYDAAGYPVRTEARSGNSGYSFDYTYDDGNLSAIKMIRDNKLNYTGTYTIDKTKANTTEWRIVGYFPSPIFGAKGKNVTTEYKALNPDGTTNWHTRTSYEYDTEGYISRSVTTNQLSNFVTRTTFSYE